MSFKSGKPSANPDTSNLSKISEKLKGMQKGMEKPIEMITKLWGKFSEMIGGLDKKFLTPLMAPFIGILNSFADMNPDKKKKDKEKPDSKKEAPKGVTAIASTKPKKGTERELEDLMGEIKPEQKPLDHTKIHSAPFERGKNKSTKYPKGVTLCAKTARLNLKKFGFDRFFPAKKATEALTKGNPFEAIGLPSGDAHDVRDYYIKSDQFEKFVGENNNIQKQLKGNNKNIAHLVVKSHSMAFEHTAVAFRSSVDGKWYVLDPYRKGCDEKPIPFEEYGGTIIIAVPLSASKSPSENIA